MRKRKGFNPELSSTFAKAVTKFNVPEDYERTLILYIGTVDYKILKHQNCQLSFVSESVEAPTKVP